MILSMKPPYKITGEILGLVAAISEQIGEVKSAKLTKPQTRLRRKNRIRTIQSSLEIEGNTMTIGQVTDLMDNKRVIAPQKDIIEVRNAIEVYANLHRFNPFKPDDLCAAHRLMMDKLTDKPGQFRTTAVGIARGEQITHIAPPGHMVASLINNLFGYLRNDDDILLIKSCVFHYELEFIHPFTDGNGRMGRLWQSLILMKYSPVFEFLPLETLIKEGQQEYYAVLGRSDREGNSTAFIRFMLEIIHRALEELLSTQNTTVTDNDRIQMFRDVIGSREFSRQEYMRHNKEISPATASRDLKNAVDRDILAKSGDKRLTRYKFRE